jgi:abhydrolase domain-containing protein 17
MNGYTELAIVASMIAAAYAALVVAAHWFSLRMIFPRPASSYAPTADHVLLTAPDGVLIVGRHWPDPEARFTILWFHGNGEDLGTIVPVVDEWRRHGFAVFAIDYRGYGASGGSPTEANTYSDAAMAFDWLRVRLGVPAGRIIVMGYSVGSGPAVAIAAREPLAGVMLLAPFTSSYRVITRWPLVIGDKFNNLAKLSRVRAPIFIMHGTADQTIPVWHGRMVFSKAPGPKSCLWIEGAGHGDMLEVAGARYWQAVQEFVDSLPCAPPPDGTTG